MNTENKQLLSIIDSIDEIVLESEFSVLSSLYDLYNKTNMFLEYYNGELNNSPFIQEMMFMEADTETKTENKAVKVLKTIGKAIITTIKMLVNRITSLFKKIKTNVNHSVAYDFYTNGEKSVIAKTAKSCNDTIDTSKSDRIIVKDSKGEQLCYVLKQFVDKNVSNVENDREIFSQFYACDLKKIIIYYETIFEIYDPKTSIMFTDSSAVKKPLEMSREIVKVIRDKSFRHETKLNIDELNQLSSVLRKVTKSFTFETENGTEKDIAAFKELQKNNDIIFHYVANLVFFMEKYISDETLKESKTEEFHSSIVEKSFDKILTYCSYKNSAPGFQFSYINTNYDKDNSIKEPDLSVSDDKITKLLRKIYEDGSIQKPCFGNYDGKYFTLIHIDKAYPDSEKNKEYSEVTYQNYGFITQDKSVGCKVSSFFKLTSQNTLTRMFNNVCLPYESKNVKSTNKSSILINMSDMHSILDKACKSSMAFNIEPNRIYFVSKNFNKNHLANLIKKEYKLSDYRDEGNSFCSFAIS